MEYKYFLFFLIFIIIIFIIIVIIIIKKNNNFICNKIFYNNINNEDIYYDKIIFNTKINNDKTSQERLILLSNYLLQKVKLGHHINFSIIEILNNNYDKATQNWYTKNIGIPKRFLMALWLDKEYIFQKSNLNNNIILLLDKIFSSEQNIRDNLSNGYDVILYNYIYMTLQGKFPFLKQYDCHKNKDYIEKMLKILITKFNVIDTISDGFFKDYSFIYHKNIPYNSSYLRELFQDLFWIKNYKFYEIMSNVHKNYDYSIIDTNIEFVFNYIKPFIYGKFINYNGLGRSLTRHRLINSIYTFLYDAQIFFPICYNDYKYFYENDFKSHNFMNENVKYLLPIIGMYAWYGKNYDNYIINFYSSKIENEIVISENDGDLLVKSNYSQSILFGDENLPNWYKNVNHLNLNKPIILAGCLLDNNFNILNPSGWMSSFYKEIFPNIEIVVTYANNITINNDETTNEILTYYIIDKNINMLSIYISIKQKSTYYFYPASIYQDDSFIICNEYSNNKITIYSAIRPRTIISDNPKLIEIETKYSTNNYARVRYEINEKNNNLFHVTTHLNYKIPKININNNILNYDDKFTIENDITTKFIEGFNVLLISNKNEQTYVVVDSNIPENFTTDNSYRCYLNK